MEKIVLFTFVFLAAVLMVNGEDNDTTASPTSTATPGSNMTSPSGNMTTTPTTVPGPEPTTAAAAIQPLAIFVLACAFLGLMH